METCETTQPWVIYTYGRTHDHWWPFWTSTRVLGRARIGMECMVCGHAEVVSLPIPRLRGIPDKGRHPERVRFLREHAHPDRGHPASWVRPLRNLDAWPGGLNPDLLAARLEADLKSPQDPSC